MEITVSQNVKTKNHRTGTMSLRTSSQLSSSSSSSPISCFPSWHEHIHLCGFSDRTVMALHKRTVAMHIHNYTIQTSPDESKAKVVHSRPARPPSPTRGLCPWGCVGSEGQVKAMCIQTRCSSALCCRLLSASLRYLIGQILCRRDLSSGILRCIVCRPP